MAPPNTTDTTYLDTQLDAMTAQLSVLSFAPTTVTSALADRFPSLNSSVFMNLAQTLCSHSKKLSGLVNNDPNDPSEKLSHHIKFDEESLLSYCDVIYDNETKQCTLLLKMKEAEKFEGQYKRATKQIAIQIDPDTGLRFCPVVSLKAKDDSNESVITEATNEGALAFRCVSGSDSRGKTRTRFNRKGKERAVQLDKGITVKDAMKNAMKTDTDNAQKKEEEALLSNLCHYMKQIGFQLVQMHQNGHTHFDVKPANILVRPSEVTRDGQTTGPVYTLIDIPDEKIEPATMKESFDITFTARYSPPWQGRLTSTRMTFLTNLGLTEDKLDKFRELAGVLPNANLCGHMFDSYAFLIVLGEQIATFDAERNKEDFQPFKDFFVAQMDLYLDAALAIARGESKKWPENLTVSGITQSFTEMIKEKCKNKVFLLDALKDADILNAVPPQPLNQTGNLPESDATTLPKATATLEDLITQQLPNIQNDTQITLWMKVWDFIFSFFYGNSMNHRQAKNILVDFCQNQEADVTRVIEAFTFIRDKKMVTQPSALVSLVLVIDHLRGIHTSKSPLHSSGPTDVSMAEAANTVVAHHKPLLSLPKKS